MIHIRVCALLEAFLAGEIGVRVLCNELVRLDLPVEVIVQGVDAFHAQGRLPARTAQLIRDHVLSSPAGRERSRPSAVLAQGSRLQQVSPAPDMPAAVLQGLPEMPTQHLPEQGQSFDDGPSDPLLLREMRPNEEGLLLRMQAAARADRARAGSGKPVAGAMLPYPQRPLPVAGGAPASAIAITAGAGILRSSASTQAMPAAQDQIEDMITAALVGDLRGVRPTAPSPSGASQPQRSVMARQLSPWLTPFRNMQARRKASREAEGEGLAPKPEPVPELGPGHMLKHRFVLERQIGEGGMGRVFRAVDRRRVEVGDVQPYVALKVLSAGFRDHPDALRSLEAEARKVQLLSHPNICPIFDFDRDGPHAFFVMELLHGETLEAALDRAGGQPLHPDLRTQVLVGLFSAMSHVHRRRVVHGDLKPGNLFLCQGGPAKVLDFGVATTLRGRGFDPSALKAFTPAFSSPEMIEGAPRDPRDDVFSMGCLIYLAWTGRHPYRRLPANQARDTGLAPPPVEQMPAAANMALMSALAFEREARPEDAGALGLAMLPSLAGRNRGG